PGGATRNDCERSPNPEWSCVADRWHVALWIGKPDVPSGHTGTVFGSGPRVRGAKKSRRSGRPGPVAPFADPDMEFVDPDI
ncbi:MAG TPA: hypothetical protein PK857_11625, partial [Hyphomicrobium sp.]|nr:hypothetical protein [Hyphomicrobium sp.]